MSRRGENIRKRKDGRWEARYKKSVDPSGNAVYGSVYGRTYREAKAKQLERIQNIARPAADRPPYFREVLALWIDSSRTHLKGASEYRYRTLISRHILPKLGNMRISELTGPVLNAFLADKLDHGRLDGNGGLSPSYVRSILLVIQSALNYAATENLCIPLQSKVYKPSVIQKEIPILSTSDQKKLEHACMTDPDTTKAGVLLSLYAGLRIGEVCALAWEDIEWDTRIIHVRHTVARVSKPVKDGKKATELILDRPKTASSRRDVPLCSKLIPVLFALKKQKVSPYVISTREAFISPRTYDYRYRRLLHSSGIPEINYHALRHTFATRCIEVGMDIKSLSEILGHANAAVTLNTYVHSSVEKKRAQLEKLAENT